VGASFTSDNSVMRGSVEVVNRWRLVEASLVPAGKDPSALTRSIPNTTNTMETASQATEHTANTEATASGEQELSRAEANRQLQIIRSAAVAKLSDEETDEIIRTTKTTAQGLMAVVTRHAAAVEGRASSAGHPARINIANDNSGGIENEISRALAGDRLDQPLWLTLRSAGIGHGNDGPSVWRSALAGEGRWLSRALSTSDLPNLLTATGNRRLMEKFAVADAGIRLAANVRQLQDYRSAGIIDAGMIGTAKAVLEGGEVQFSAVDETAASYKPTRYALGLSFTPQALSNDDLSALDVAIGELAEAMLDSEAVALVDLLEGAALGRNAPDGKSLFHADHGNVVTGGITIASIGAAVAKMRQQKSLGGRFIAQNPAAIIVGTDQETNVRQLLSGAIQAAQASNVNPWNSLQVAVEPRLSGSFAYIVGSARKALELGRLTAGPVLTTEVDFSTSCYRAKSEHVFGAIVAEHRSIVRLATA
jgi:hypothetical protein